MTPIIGAISLEVVSTAATLFTAIVIGATAVAALIQLRHLRAGNDIAAMLSIGEHFSSEEFKHNEELVVHKLAVVMADPSFRDYLISYAREQAPREVSREYADVRRAGVLIGNIYEELGILVKAGIVNKALFLDRYCYVIPQAWNRLADFAALTREAADDPGIWENFEYITVMSQNWMQSHPSDYPRGVRRLDVRSRWPVPRPQSASTAADGQARSTFPARMGDA